MEVLVKNYNDTIFENIKHIDEKGDEYWLGRELQEVLEYNKWQKFLNVIENTKNACEQSKFSVDGKNIYLKCIEEVILKKDSKEINLKEYLNNNDFNAFVTELDSQMDSQIYKDGGTKIYKKDNITLVVCKRIIDEDNYLEDIYFGNSKLTYDNSCG